MKQAQMHSRLTALSFERKLDVLWHGCTSVTKEATLERSKSRLFETKRLAVVLVLLGEQSRVCCECVERDL